MLKPAKCLLGFLSALGVLTASGVAGAQLALDWSKRDQWQWFGGDTGNLPYTPLCMDGSATGFAIYVPSSWNNPSGTNNNVLYWFDGGGECWDATTCSNPTPNIQTLISNLGNLPPAPFVFRQNFTRDVPQGCTNSSLPCYQNNLAWYTTNSANQLDVNGMLSPKAILSQGIFDHSSGSGNINPFKNYIEVFIPYCTGDFHIGYNHDTTNSAFRQASQKYFWGFYNAYYDVSFADTTVRLEINAQPPKVVVTGGSAGGYGALLNYGMIRSVLPTGEKITVISDAGVPYYEGYSQNGTNWYSSTFQGFAGMPTPRTNCPNNYPNMNGAQCASTTAVTYQQALMSNAWGTSTWQSFVHNTLGLNPATPAGSPGPFLSMAQVFYQEAFANPKTSTDRFYILDGSNDWLAPIFFSMYPNGTAGQTATVSAGQNQLITLYGYGSQLHQITTAENGFGTYAGSLPWSQHHGFLLNDVSTWDNTTSLNNGKGSGLIEWLNSIGGW